LFLRLYADQMREKTNRQVLKVRPAGIMKKAATDSESGGEVRNERNKLAGRCHRYAF
jgi:hypothetical protein